MIYINFIYRIEHLLFIVCKSIRGKPPLLTEQFDKFIQFRSIFYRFKFETMHPQEFANHSKDSIFFLVKSRGQSCKANFGINYIKNGLNKPNFHLNYINFDVIYDKKVL